MLYDRIFLASIIAGNWALIRIIEESIPEKAHAYLPKPFALYVLIVFVVAMAIHTTWLTLAQKRRGFFNTRFEGAEDLTDPLNLNLPSIDIFLALHNEESVIAKTIENLLELNYPNYFIYLINDRSTDKTKTILEEYKSKNPHKLKVLNIPTGSKGGKAKALNYAYSHSSGELIAVFDADAKVKSDFLLKMLPYLEGDNVGGVQSRKTISNYSVNNLTKLQENEYCLDSYYQCGKDVIHGTVEFRGNGQIVKRKVLEEVGLWDEETLTDDLELSTRFILHGWQIRFCNEASVSEQGVTTSAALMKQRLRWCEGSLRRHITNLPKILGPGKCNFTQKFDTLMFLCQFAVPVWIFFDAIAELIRFISGEQTHITFFMLATFAVWVITWFSLCCGIRIYRKLSWPTSIIRGFETNVYLLTTWPTIVLLTFRKILFSRSRGKWDRTQHHAEAEVEVG